jgi:hypothetical protein
MIPLAGALTRAGHDVLVACVPQLVPTLTQAGLTVTAVPADQTVIWADLVRSGEFVAPGGIAAPEHNQLIEVVGAARSSNGPSAHCVRQRPTSRRI